MTYSLHEGITAKADDGVRSYAYAVFRANA